MVFKCHQHCWLTQSSQPTPITRNITSAVLSSEGTSRHSLGQVRKVIWRLFDLWPTAEAAAGADEGAIGDVINVLGLFKRSATVKRFSQEYLSKQVRAAEATSLRHSSHFAIPCLCVGGHQIVS